MPRGVHRSKFKPTESQAKRLAEFERAYDDWQRAMDDVHRYRAKAQKKARSALKSGVPRILLTSDRKTGSVNRLLVEE